MFQRFLKETQGAVAVIFGVTVMLTVLTVGIAVDGSRMESTRAHMQLAIDSATLAAVLDTTTGGAQQRLTTVYASNAGVGAAKLDAFNLMNGSASAEGSAMQMMPTTFMALFGWNEVEIAVQASAKRSSAPDELTFTPGVTWGDWNKTITLYGTDTSGVVQSLMTITYTYDMATTVATTTVSPADSVSVIDYKNLVLEMSVPEAASNGYPATIRTDDPSLSHRIFINGVGVKPNSVVNILDSTSCSQEREWAWEDGGTPALADGTTHVDSADFRFTIKGTCSGINPKMAHLTE